MRERAWTLVTVVTLLVLAGCQLPRTAVAPMPFVVDELPAPASEKALLVFLPGRGDTVQHVLGQGIVEMVRERGIAADVVFADCHMGYYRDRSLPDRLWHDVLEPATARGYTAIWLCGISLGGFGSLLYATESLGTERDCVDGILAIAPYLGDREAIAEITSAGGLGRWQPPEQLGSEDYTRRIWSFLSGYARAKSDRPMLFVGVGDRDAFAAPVTLLGDALPAGQSIVIPGGHTWAPWLEIWGTMLDLAPLPRLGTTGAARAAQPPASPLAWRSSTIGA